MIRTQIKKENGEITEIKFKEIKGLASKSLLITIIVYIWIILIPNIIQGKINIGYRGYYLYSIYLAEDPTSFIIISISNLLGSGLILYYIFIKNSIIKIMRNKYLIFLILFMILAPYLVFFKYTTVMLGLKTTLILTFLITPVVYLIFYYFGKYMYKKQITYEDNLNSRKQ